MCIQIYVVTKLKTKNNTKMKYLGILLQETYKGFTISNFWRGILFLIDFICYEKKTEIIENFGGTDETWTARRIGGLNLWVYQECTQTKDVVKLITTSTVLNWALYSISIREGYDLRKTTGEHKVVIDHLSETEDTLIKNLRKEAEEKRKMQPQPEFSDLGDEPEVTLPEGYEEVNFA
jgi:hypothetical protein